MRAWPVDWAPLTPSRTAQTGDLDADIGLARGRFERAAPEGEAVGAAIGGKSGVIDDEGRAGESASKIGRGVEMPGRNVP